MTLTRRRLLQNSFIFSGSLYAAACSQPTIAPVMNTSTNAPKTSAPTHTVLSQTHDNSMRFFASSGFCEDHARIQNGLDLLSRAGFVLSNQAAAYRRFQRFAGQDAQRIADLQDVATGRVPTPKVLMGVRGGYGAVRLLPHIDWGNLAARMREKQTLLFGFSDVTAIQLALLTKGMSSFAGPMLYSEFAKPAPDVYTMDSFMRHTTQAQTTITVPIVQSNPVREAEGILWGGNLSVLASLVGTPFMPDIQGGLLFLEDVSEQPYRIERMLQTLHLAGILRKQQAIILGDFRMGNIRDVYDSSYDLNHVAQTMSRITRVPIYRGFPFGHITNKTTFALGARAHLRSDHQGGYLITISGYPTLNPQALNLNALLSPPPSVIDFTAPDRTDF